ncbi:MAG: GAF domain-containing protein, partial [Chloroflexi bacterium]|nr:GAF domain-containing protein [Chloroflexota bacterium]
FEELAGIQSDHSCLGAPLLTQDRLLGVLTVDRRQSGGYDQEAAELVAAFARQAAIAIDNAQLYQAQRQRAEQLGLLNQVGRRIAAILDPDELLDQVVRLVRDTFGYYNVSIGLVEGDDIVFGHGVIDPAKLPDTPPPPLPLRLSLDGPGLIAWAAREGQTVNVPDVSAEPRYMLVQYLPAARSELVVSLKVGDRVVGVLDVESDQLAAFDEADQTMMESLADQIAIALENARLVQEQQEQAWVTTALFQASESLASLTHLEDILDTTVRLTPILVGVDRCLIVLWNPEQKRYTASAAYGLSASAHQEFMGRRFKPGELLLLDEVRLTRQSQEVIDVPSDGRIPAHWVQAWELDAVLAMPLISKNEVLGVLVVDFNRPAQESPARSEAIVAGMANQAAIAIESAQLYEALQEEAWVSTAMLQVAEAVGRLTDLDEILSTVARITPLLVGVDRCSIFLWDEARQSFYASQIYGLPRALFDEFMALRFSPAEIPALENLRNDPKPIVIHNPQEQDQLPQSIIQAFGVKALLTLPLVARGEVMGLMLVDYTEDSTRFTTRRVDVVQGIANQAAIAVETAQLYRETAAKDRMERELQVARQIQTSFLPDSCPAIPGWQVAAEWRSARQVGGDFYDFIELPGDCWGLVVADVSDKGVPAALFMALSRTMIRAAAAEGRQPAQLLSQVNTLMLADTRSEMFVTAFYAMLDTRQHSLTYANAGHNPPLLVRAQTGELVRLANHGIVLGIVPDVMLENSPMDLALGDVLVLYTDGVTDAIDAQDHEFGEERLAALVQQHAHRPAREIVAAIDQAVADFVGDTPAFDDFTLVVLKHTSVDDTALAVCEADPGAPRRHGG